MQLLPLPSLPLFPFYLYTATFQKYMFIGISTKMSTFHNFMSSLCFLASFFMQAPRLVAVLPKTFMEINRSWNIRPQKYINIFTTSINLERCPKTYQNRPFKLSQQKQKLVIIRLTCLILPEAPARTWLVVQVVYSFFMLFECIVNIHVVR